VASNDFREVHITGLTDGKGAVSLQLDLAKIIIKDLKIIKVKVVV